MVKHIDSWFAFVQKLGLGIEQMEEIILITGLHLTRSWANVVFLEDRENSHASFGVKVDNDSGITWQFLPGSVQGGMGGCGPQGKVCQLARYLEMTLRWSCTLVRTYPRTNVFLYEGFVLPVSLGYFQDDSGQLQDPIRV
jgi:hypothetical protein